MTIAFAELKKEMLANPEVAAEYERLDRVYELVGSMIDARHAGGLTQGRIAAKVGLTSPRLR